MLAFVPIEVAGALISTALAMHGNHAYSRIPSEVRHNGNQWIATQHQGLGDDSPRAVRLLVDYGYDAAQRNREEYRRLERLHLGVLDVLHQCDKNLALQNVDAGFVKGWTVKKAETQAQADEYRKLMAQCDAEYAPVEHMEWQWPLTELDV